MYNLSVFYVCAFTNLLNHLTGPCPYQPIPGKPGYFHSIGNPSLEQYCQTGFVFSEDECTCIVVGQSKYFCCYCRCRCSLLPLPLLPLLAAAAVAAAAAAAIAAAAAAAAAAVAAANNNIIIIINNNNRLNNISRNDVLRSLAVTCINRCRIPSKINRQHLMKWRDIRP